MKNLMMVGDLNFYEVSPEIRHGIHYRTGSGHLSFFSKQGKKKNQALVIWVMSESCDHNTTRELAPGNDYFKNTVVLPLLTEKAYNESTL